MLTPAGTELVHSLTVLILRGVNQTGVIIVLGCRGFAADIVHPNLYYSPGQHLLRW